MEYASVLVASLRAGGAKKSHHFYSSPPFGLISGRVGSNLRVIRRVAQRIPPVEVVGGFLGSPVHHQRAVESEQVAGDQVTLDGSSSALPTGPNYDPNPHAMPCNSGKCWEQKTLLLCEVCKPVQCPATTDRALVMRLYVSGS
jgi:hypothetical protein